MTAKLMKELRRVNLRIEDTTGDPLKRFDAARSAAVREAGKFAFLIAWRDQINGRFSPCVDKCDLDEVESWEVYGMSHDADLRVDVDNGRYSFLFKTK